MAHPRVAAGVLFFDPDGRVLLVKPSYKDGWDIPGGYVEPHETPLEACKREVREELDVDPTIFELLVVDWAPSTAEGDKLLFVFNAGTMTSDQTEEIQLSTDELEGWAFKTRNELDDLMPARLQRRVDAAIQARSAGRTTYLEHGELRSDLQTV